MAVDKDRKASAFPPYPGCLWLLFALNASSVKRSCFVWDGEGG